MSTRPVRFLASLAAVALVVGAARAGTVTADFEDLSLAPDSAFQGPMPGSTVVGGVARGSFVSQGVSFANRYSTIYGSWSGFAYSNQTDASTQGWTNQFSVYAGAAHSGSNFGVAFGYEDTEPTMYDPDPFNPLDILDLRGLPNLTLPDLAVVQGMYVANTTYTALSLLYGDSFSGRPMGGVNGDIPDWYKVSAYGSDAAGNVLTDASGAALSVDLYLADNRQGQGFIADQWLYMDLSALAGASQLYFNVSGTLTGAFGLNTPGYFAMDDLTYSVNAAAVPEPASLAMAGAAVLIVGLAARRRRRA